MGVSEGSGNSDPYPIHPRRFVVPTPIIISFTSPSFLTDSYRFRYAWDGQPVPNCCWVSHAVVFVVIDRKGDQSIPVRGMRMCHPASWTVSDAGFYRRQSLVAIWLVDCNSTNILSGLIASQDCAAWTSLTALCHYKSRGTHELKFRLPAYSRHTHSARGEP